ncbi:MAG: outer membrane protein assembly factor BamD [Planctomycetota bacterium]
MRSYLLLLVFLLIGCSAVPEWHGQKASSYAPAEIHAAAASLLEEERFEPSAELSEYLIRTSFGYEKLEEVLFLAGEARFHLQEYDEAFLHYRRLMAQYPYTARTVAVSKRIWVVGKELIDRRGGWFGDLSSLHEVGVEALNFLVTTFPRSSYADDAWKELAEAFALDHHHQAVADIYERLIREYPESEWTDLATYKVTQAYRAQSRGFAYDVDPLLRAHAALKRYLRAFPEGNFVEQAQADLKELEEDVVRHELEIAQFYRERGLPEGERLHLANAATRFPDSLQAQEASEVLEEQFEGPGEDSTDLLRPREDRPIWQRGAATGGDPGRDSGKNR